MCLSTPGWNCEWAGFLEERWGAVVLGAAGQLVVICPGALALDQGLAQSPAGPPPSRCLAAGTARRRVAPGWPGRRYGAVEVEACRPEEVTSHVLFLQGHGCHFNMIIILLQLPRNTSWRWRNTLEEFLQGSYLPAKQPASHSTNGVVGKQHFPRVCGTPAFCHPRGVPCRSGHILRTSLAGPHCMACRPPALRAEGRVCGVGPKGTCRDSWGRARLHLDPVLSRHPVGLCVGENRAKLGEGECGGVQEGGSLANSQFS